VVPIFNQNGQFTHVISIQKDVTERKIAEADRETFNQVLRAINQHDSFDQGMQLAASHLAKHFDCPYAEAWSINFKATRMMFRTCWTTHPRFNSMTDGLVQNIVVYGQGLIGTTLEQKSIVYWDTLHDRPFIRKHIASANKSGLTSKKIELTRS